MNIFQRFKKWAGGTSAKAITRPIWTGPVSVNPSRSGTFDTSDTGLINAVRSNVWAYNCVKARMTMVATPKMRLYKGFGSERVEIEEHPALDLLRDVNPLNLNGRSFMRGIEQQLSHFGRCIIHKNRNSTTVAELYILPKLYVEVVPDEKTYIAGYRWLPTGELISPDDIIDLYYPSADGSVKAESPTAVALAAINSYNMADRAQRAVDRRGGQKGGIVVHPEETIPLDFDAAKAAWDAKRSDPDQAGSDMHVTHGTTYIGDAFSAVEMQREERIQRLAKEIMAAYSMPPAAAGDYTDASVLANAAVQMKAAWDLHGIEELNFIAEGLTNELLWAEFDGTREAEMYFEFDLSTISALDEDTDAKVERAISIYGAQVGTLNEARALVGLPLSTDPRADQLAMIAAQPAPEKAEAASTKAEITVEPKDARPTVIPIIDPVGRMAVTLEGVEIGRIEKVTRFSVHDGIEATQEDPVVFIAGKAYKSSQIGMVVDG